ncbi:MAG TPA: PepSY domain-containing protein [Opitutaceae bacterium]|nr:PepSY domain-containing protein [Lacunisphaera sp.]HWA09084.1 PepSY domain-containing protein [Opitutaceae bacterium]
MKKFALLLLVALGLVLVAAAKEKDSAPKGTIHPARKTKPADLPALAKISFVQALNNAAAAQPGSVLKAELEVEDGCLMYSFEIVGANHKITEIEIDAGDGSVLGREDAENDKD